MRPIDAFAERQRHFVAWIFAMIPFLALSWLVERQVIVVAGLADRRWLSYPLVLAALGCFALARRALRCPKCEKRLWPPAASACPNCGEPLTEHRPGMRRAVPIGRHRADVAVVERPRWRSWERFASRAQSMLWKIALVVPTVVGLLLWALLPPSPSRGGVGTAMFGWGLAASGILFGGWFFLVYFPGRLLGPIFWQIEGKCPRCGKAFGGDVGLGAGHLRIVYSVPEHCGGCGVRLVEAP